MPVSSAWRRRRRPAGARRASSPLGIDAPVAPVGIDITNGVLGVPPPIARTGWWRDGAAPGARAGAVLIAGHVDSAGAGPGAFFELRQAKPGDRVSVHTTQRTHVHLRVVSVRDYLKRNLPPDIYSLKGRARLVLVTCGGPFLPSEGHYRDNSSSPPCPSEAAGAYTYS